MEIEDADAGVPLARAAIEAAQIQAGMQDDLEALEAARSAAAAGGMAIVAAVDLSEDEQQRRDAQYFNEQAGMHME